MELARRDELDPYVTRDGSAIREWAGPGRAAAARNQSLAEATVAPGASTVPHHHRASEELYLITAGTGLLRVGGEEREVRPGDCVAIPPGTVHGLRNTGAVDLVVVCACSPPYSHEDTFLAAEGGAQAMAGDGGGTPLRLREAVPGDALAVARLHIASWRDAYRELMPAEFLAALDPADRARRYTFDAPGRNAPATVLALDADEAIWGFSTFGPSRDADTEGLGELYALYVDPARLGAGTGRLLIADARARLAARGHREAILWTLIGNTPAQRFYERDGWVRDGGERVEEPYGIVSTVVRYRRALP